MYLIWTFIQHELEVLGSGLGQEKEIIKYKKDWKKEIKVIIHKWIVYTQKIEDSTDKIVGEFS